MTNATAAPYEVLLRACISLLLIFLRPKTFWFCNTDDADADDADADDADADDADDNNDDDDDDLVLQIDIPHTLFFSTDSGPSVGHDGNVIDDDGDDDDDIDDVADGTKQRRLLYETKATACR